MALRKDRIEVPENAPYPDVWAPLSEDLRLLSGSAPFDVSGGITLPTKSIAFTRATTATYIDKAGELKTAAINEPRFERAGLLMEGSSTNYFLNSDDPTKWLWQDTTLVRDVKADGLTKAITGSFTTTAENVDAQFIQSQPITLTVGQAITASCRVKGSSGVLRFRIINEGLFYANVDLDLTTGAIYSGSIATTPGPNHVTGYATRSEPDGYWNFSGTFLAEMAATYTVQFRIRRLGQENIPLGTQVSLQMPQAEMGNVRSSYIPTSGATTTRAADVASIPSINGGLDVATIACTVSRLWPIQNVPNTAPRVFSSRVGSGISSDAWEGAFNAVGIAHSFGGRTNGASTVPGFVDGQVFTSIKLPAGLSTVIPAGKVIGNQGTTATLLSPIYLGNAKEINRPLFGHIRNFRIWHRELTPDQIRGLR